MKLPSLVTSSACPKPAFVANSWYLSTGSWMSYLERKKGITTADISKDSRAHVVPGVLPFPGK